MHGRLVLALSLLSACGPEGEIAAAETDSSNTSEPPCEPGSTEPCSCEEGSPSERTCLDSGEFDACECPACGDGVVDDDEACDDGNLEAGDGCDAQCDYESGTVLFDIEIGDHRDLVMTTDGRVGVKLRGRVAVYDLEGERAWRSAYPAVPHVPGVSGNSSIAALENGGLLYARSDCSSQSTDPCDVWGHYDRDGELVWEHVFGDVGEVEAKIVRPSSAGGFLVSGGLRETSGEPVVPVVRYYSADLELEWEVRTQKIAWDFARGPEGDAAVFRGTTEDGNSTIRAIDLEGRTLSTPVVIPDSPSSFALGGEGVIYVASQSQEGAFPLRKLSATGEQLWAARVPLLAWPFGVVELGRGEVLVSVYPLDGMDEIYVLDAEGNIDRSHDLGGSGGAIILDPNNFVLALTENRLVRFAP